MTTAPAARLSPFAVFRNKNFSRMWTGQLVSTIGTALTSLAASILVFRLTDSAMSVGLMLMATAAPSLLVGLFAGVVVDRYDRKKIMLAADLIRAVLVFLIPFLVPHNIIWLYVIVMLTSAIGQFFDPAQESVLPEVASEQELAAANSLMAISSFGATAVGFAASGLIASAANINLAFYLDAATFLFSAACIFLIRVKPLQAEEDTSAAVVFKNLKAGLSQLFDTPILRSLFTAQVPTLLAFGLSNALLLPFAIKALKATEEQLTLLLSDVRERMKTAEDIFVVSEDFQFSCHSVLKNPQLSPAYGSQQVAHPVVVPDLAVLVVWGRVSCLLRQGTCPFHQPRIRGNEHPPSGCRDDLVPVERERRRRAEGSGGLPLVGRAERLCRVFYEGNAVPPAGGKDPVIIGALSI